MKELTIGVLALQGAFAKHAEMLRALGANVIEVRKPSELAACDGLVIPGGESTTMMKQMDFIEFQEPFKLFAQQKPVFGTCAGVILMSKEILGDTMKPFNLLDISVERNAFGRQVESFHTDIDISFTKGKSAAFEAVFIRAPRIKRLGEEVNVLGDYEGEAVLVQQDFHLGATFHPELTQNTAIHAHFLSIVKQA